MIRTYPLQGLVFKPTLGNLTYAAGRIGQLAEAVSRARLLLMWAGVHVCDAGLSPMVSIRLVVVTEGGGL